MAPSSQTEASELPVTASNIVPAHSSSESPVTTQHSGPYADFEVGRFFFEKGRPIK